MLVVVGACEGNIIGDRGSWGILPAGPDFNGGFDRRPFSSYTLLDGGTAYEWPTSIPDGWTVTKGTWNRGIFDLYGEGFDAGPPLRCQVGGGGSVNCPGTGDAPNGSALTAGVCRPENGGCEGANEVRSMAFPVSGGTQYVLGFMMKGRWDFVVLTPPGPAKSATAFHIDWAAGTTPLSTTDVQTDIDLIDRVWTEYRYAVMAPAAATSATLRVELDRDPRDVRLDSVVLSPQ